MGQTTVNRRLGPRMLMVVAVGCRHRCGGCCRDGKVESVTKR